MKFTDLPKLGQQLEEGIFAGVITQQDGTHCAVVLLPNQHANKPAPDCRTCDYRSLDSDENDYCLQKCTNGDQYQPAPAVVLWRTE